MKSTQHPITIGNGKKKAARNGLLPSHIRKQLSADEVLIEIDKGPPSNGHDQAIIPAPSRELSADEALSEAHRQIAIVNKDMAQAIQQAMAEGTELAHSFGQLLKDCPGELEYERKIVIEF